MKFHVLADWLEWLEQQHPKEIDLGLDRIHQVASRMQLDFSSTAVISVAGTNGKGSFVASASTLLRSAGKRVACYTSPHFLLFNERVNLNGVLASDEQLVGAFDAVESVLNGISLTYFEYTTLAALYLFQQECFDYVILEVGLGGRLDAVNIIDADIAVITSIGLDHQEYLGSDRDSVAREKIGIFRQGKPVICVEESLPDSLKVALSSARTLAN